MRALGFMLQPNLRSDEVTLARALEGRREL